MGPVKCSVKEQWFDVTDDTGHKIRSWGTKKDQTTVHCKLCNAPISIESKGVQALIQHSKTEKHRSAASVLDGSQLVLARTPSTSTQHEGSASGTGTGGAPRTVIQLGSLRDAALKAELLWVMKCVVNGQSLASCDNVVDVFKAMFGAEHVPEDMSLGRTKAGYLVTDALGPHFRGIMLEECQKALSFTICYDETTNSKHRKELKIGVRFWSEKLDEVVFCHLETFFIGVATGEILKKHVMTSINNGNLSCHKMVSLSNDGPNVNKTVLRLVSQELFDLRGKKLLDPGTCNLHVLHNSFLEGLKVFGLEISDLAVLVHKFFTDFPARVECYQTVQEMKQVPQHSFSKHVSSRWLTLSAAAERLVEQWPALKHYFLREIPSKTGHNYKTMRESDKFVFISKCLKDPLTVAEMEFVIQIAKLFERFSLFFQKTEPLIHLLYEELFNLYILLIGKICKPDAISKASKSACLKEGFFRDSSNLLNLDKVELGDRTVQALKNLNERDVLKFRQNAQKHYHSAAQHLLNKSVLGKWPEAKHFRCFQPGAIKEPDSVRRVVNVHNVLQLDLNVDTDALRDEWKLLQLEKLPEYNSSTRVDHFWREVFAIRNAAGCAKYPSITTVVKAALPIAHGSADVERGFNDSKIQLPCNRTRTEERLHNARLNILDGVRRNGGRVDQVPISRELLNAGHNAYRNYKDHLEDHRKLKEEELKKKEQEEALRLEREAAEEQQRKGRQNISKLEKELDKKEKEASKERQAADTLVNEATEKLATALKKGDLAGAKVAQGMLEGAKAMRDRAAEVTKNAAPLQKTLKRRTNTLLDMLLKKNKRAEPEKDDRDQDPIV